MPENPVVQTIDDARLASALRDRARTMNGEGEVTIDLSQVRCLDANGIRALEELAEAADKNATKIVLSGVNVSVYKVLKLVKVSSRFSFMN
jgi:anti-anti-sigma regulatory factor